MQGSTRRRIFDWSLFGLGVAALYLTLPIVRRLQFAISQAGGDPVLNAAPFVVLGLGLALGLGWLLFVRGDRRPMTFFLLGNVGVAYFLVLTSLADIPIERMHLIEYGVVAILAYRCTRHYWPQTKAYGVAMLLVFDVGFVDEVIQFFLPTRVYDTRDVVTNGLAGLLGLLAVMAARRPLPGPERETKNAI